MGNGSGNGGRRFLDITVASLLSVLGTVFVLWLTVGGKFVTRDEMWTNIKDYSPWVQDRATVWAAITAATHGTEIGGQEVRALLRELEGVKIEQGRTGVKLDDIARRLK